MREFLVNQMPCFDIVIRYWLFVISGGNQAKGNLQRIPVVYIFQNEMSNPSYDLCPLPPSVKYSYQTDVSCRGVAEASEAEGLYNFKFRATPSDSSPSVPNHTSAWYEYLTLGGTGPGVTT